MLYTLKHSLRASRSFDVSELLEALSLLRLSEVICRRTLVQPVVLRS